MSMNSDLAEGIRKWRKLRTQRIELDHQLDALKKDEAAARNYIISELRGKKGVVVEGRETGVTTESRPFIENEDVFKEHVLAARALDLLQMNLAIRRFAALQQEGRSIPGVGYLDKFDLYDRKAK